MMIGDKNEIYDAYLCFKHYIYIDILISIFKFLYYFGIRCNTCSVLISGVHLAGRQFTVNLSTNLSANFMIQFEDESLL